MAGKAPAKRTGIEEAAAALGRSRRCLDRWREAGAPGFADEGGVTVVDVEAVRAWALSQGRKLEAKKRKAPKKNAAARPPASARAPEMEASRGSETPPAPAHDEGGEGDAEVPYLEARRRKELAQAKIRELQALKLAGELLPKAEVEAAALRRVKAARSLLIALPGRLADRLAAEDDAVKVENALEETVDEVLRALAGPSAIERKAARAG